MFKKTMLVIGLGISSLANAQDLPIEVTYIKHQRNIAPYVEYKIMANADEVIFTGVKANRGNCPIEVWEFKMNPVKATTTQLAFPIKKVFGQQLSIVARCNAMELTVETNLGSWSLKTN
ncbi:hypothetical protein [Serratia fonticola]|uniref:hypothetical protein n=1 Tax=Serratia fonticola TaxID=47917 RepID=UPI00217B69D9|nr:hypothetical protein [Serratia fonticola]CAI1228613.1 Uncharacterised protein [Serratia fonticola]